MPVPAPENLDTHHAEGNRIATAVVIVA